jgi:hypothetical protein
MRLASLLLCVSTVGFASTWSGFLVDSRCYTTEQANVSQDAPLGSRDMSRQIRTCTAKSGTRHFGVVPADWKGLRFDGKGNSQAARLVQKRRKGTVMKVTVAGVRQGNTIKVASVSGVPIPKPR